MALHSYGARCAVVGLGAVLPNHNQLSKQRWTTMANSQAGPRRQGHAEKHNFHSRPRSANIVMALYSYGLYIYDRYRYGLYSYGLHSSGLYSSGLYSYGLHSYGLYSYGLYSYGLNSYGVRCQRCSAPSGRARRHRHATTASPTSTSPCSGCGTTSAGIFRQQLFGPC